MEAPVVRKLFFGSIEQEFPLGTYIRGLQRIKQSLLFATVDGERVLVLERRAVLLIPISAGVAYFHLPMDGLENLKRVAQIVLDGAPPPAPSTGQRAARLLLRLTQIPVGLGVLGFLFGVLATVLSGFADSPFPEPEGPATLGALFALLFIGIGGQLLGTLLASRLLDESASATMCRFLYGHPDHISEMGTWRGALGRGGFGSSLVSARLQVMRVSEDPWLVMARSHKSPLSAGVALYPVPKEQIPALLEGLAAWDTISKG